MRRRYHEVPELNTTSTADISFMLLVFFLVTTSMGADKALRRQLPPQETPKVEQRDISRRHVLEVRLDAADRLYCDGQPVTADALRSRVESFVASQPAGRPMIIVESDPQTTYGSYFAAQDAIVGAYRTLRRKMALQHYGHSLSRCSETERAAIMARYPLRISERRPVAEKGGLP